MAKSTSDSILGVIWKKSWILDHFEIFLNIAFNVFAAKPNMVLSPGEQHGVESRFFRSHRTRSM